MIRSPKVAKTTAVAALGIDMRGAIMLHERPSRGQVEIRLANMPTRHIGKTELGHAELAEPGVMGLSGHRSPEAARGYVEKSETQRLSAAPKTPCMGRRLRTRSERESVGTPETRVGMTPTRTFVLRPSP